LTISKSCLEFQAHVFQLLLFVHSELFLYPHLQFLILVLILAFCFPVFPDCCESLMRYAKPQVLIRSQQNCSKQEERQHCTKYKWRFKQLASSQKNGRSPRSSYFPRKVILSSVQIIERLLLSHMQARYFFGSYCEGSRVETETEIADEQAGLRQGRGQKTKS